MTRPGARDWQAAISHTMTLTAIQQIPRTFGLIFHGIWAVFVRTRWTRT